MPLETFLVSAPDSEAFATCAFAQSLLRSTLLLRLSYVTYVRLSVLCRSRVFYFLFYSRVLASQSLVCIVGLRRFVVINNFCHVQFKLLLDSLTKYKNLYLENVGIFEFFELPEYSKVLKILI